MILEKIKTLKNVFFHIDSRTIYLYSLVIGCLTGGMAILFHYSVHFLKDLLFHHAIPLSNHDASALNISFQLPSHWSHAAMIILIPALGGLMVGLLTYYFFPETKGTGVDHMLSIFHKHGGVMWKRTPIGKFFASVLTLGTGGSAGKEGPMALIGAGIGSIGGKFFRMGARAQRTLLLAGAAGGLGAIFRTPLGGAITAVEVLYKEDFETDALLPCIISSVTAYTIYSSVYGFGHNLSFATSIFSHPTQLLFYIALGLICSAAGYLFIRIFRGLRSGVFDRLPLHPIFKPALGGLFVGLISIFFPQVFGEGLHYIQSALDGQYSQHWWVASILLLSIALLKMLATGLTIQSGGSGGALVPTLFIGAMLGGSFGVICNHFFSDLIPSVTPFIVVGMAAFFASVTSASLGALVMVTEMTGGYELLPALMSVAVISLILSGKWSFYQNQVTNKFSSQAHLWDMNPMNLRHLKIGESFRNLYHQRAIISQTLPVNEFEKLTQETHQTDFIVKDQQEHLVGLFSLKDFSSIKEELAETKELLMIHDVLSRRLDFVTEQNTLYDAMKVLMDTDFDKVAVVRRDKERLELLGYLRHQDILEYYYRLGLQPKKGAEKDSRDKNFREGSD